jgi:hypothetical protein
MNDQKQDAHSFSVKWGDKHITATGWGIIAAIVVVGLIIGIPLIKIVLL